MKKVYIPAAVFFIAISFSSCFLGRKSSENQTPVKIAFSYSGKTTEPYSFNNYSINRSFSGNTQSREKFIYSMKNAGGSINQQSIDIFDLLKKKPDYIVIDPLGEHGYEYIIEQCSATDVPVILACGSLVLDDNLAKNIIYEIRSDYYMEAKYAADCLEYYSSGKPTVNIVILHDFSDTTESREHHNAISEVVSSHSGWNVLCRRETGNEYEYTKKMMEELIASSGRIDAVFVESENSFMAVFDAFCTVNEMPGENVQIFAFTDSKEIRNMVNKGIVAFSVLNMIDENLDALDIEKSNGGKIRSTVEKIERGRSFSRIDLIKPVTKFASRDAEMYVEKKNSNLVSRILK